MRRRYVLGAAAAALAHMDVLHERLKQFGFVEGRNLQIVDQTSSFGSSNTSIVQAAAGGIPVIFTIVGDAVAYGPVKELARPGGNLTGVSWLQRELTLTLVDPKPCLLIVAGALRT